MLGAVLVEVLSAGFPKLKAGFGASILESELDEGVPKEKAGVFGASGAGVLDLAKEEAKKLGIGF